MVPLFAAVIIAGLGIGALLSAFAARHAPAPAAKSSPVVVVHTPTPAAAKVVAQHATVQPTVTVSATPEAASPSPESATPTPAPSATTAAPTQRPSATPSPKKSVSPRRVVAADTAPPQNVAPPAAAPAGDEAATSLVRRYLEAVAHGNDGAARSALGGDSAPEDVPYLDPSLQIMSLNSTRKGGITEVQVEFKTVKGQYFGTFNVDRTGTRIMQHELIPVGGTSAH